MGETITQEFITDKAIIRIHLAFPGGGGELTIAAMDEYSRLEIGRKTYRFAREVMRDPELRAKVKARAAEIKAEEEKKRIAAAI